MCVCVIRSTMNRFNTDSGGCSTLIRFQILLAKSSDHDFSIEKSTTTTLSGVLNFMDGLVSSCCGDERVMVFTLKNKEHIDSSILKPRRIDVHIHFPPVISISSRA
ncbi:AAA-ATPase [Camellia lanceoleosa]|uniref:AAA-ATPase n=1 Tax=Camellia lanceoleosa TaxID=1840588 RepID=A0ACC0FB71_9ERIC|nr:AAA-ATPase [Camellia lanceoleosa]